MREETGSTLLDGRPDQQNPAFVGIVSQRYSQVVDVAGGGR